MISADIRRSDRLTEALIQRLRRDGHLVIGASDDEQRARYERSEAASLERWRGMCRSLRDMYRFAHGIQNESDYARWEAEQ